MEWLFLFEYFIYDFGCTIYVDWLRKSYFVNRKYIYFPVFPGATTL